MKELIHYHILWLKCQAVLQTDVMKLKQDVRSHIGIGIRRLHKAILGVRYTRPFLGLVQS